MEWSPAPSSWDPTQLPGLTSTVVHANSDFESVFKPDAIIVNAQQIITDLIRFASDGNNAVAESLSQAHRCLSWEAVVAGLNICMESLVRLIAQLNMSELDPVIETILSSPDAPAAQWLRLLVALFSTVAASSLASGLASHACNLFQNWLTASQHALAPITIVVLHLHRQLIPAVLLMLERDLASHNPMNLVHLNTNVASSAVKILDYASTVRPEDIAKQAETLCQRLEAALEANGSTNAIWEVLRLLVPLLAQSRLAECLLPQFLEFASSKAHLEPRLCQLLEADLTASKQDNSLAYKILVVSQLRNVVLERINMLGSAPLAQVLLLAQRMKSWRFAADFAPKYPEAKYSMFESIVSKLYGQLMGAMNEAAPSASTSAVRAANPRFSQSLKDLLEHPKIEQELNHNVYNMLFRWLSFATAASESAQASSPFAPNTAPAARGPNGANSDRFKSMMVRIFKTAFPAYYVDRGVLDELDKARHQLSASEIATILQNIVLHLDGEPAASSFRMEEIRRHVPFRLLLKALELDDPDSDMAVIRGPSWVLDMASFILNRCCDHVTPMNLYLFVHSGLELLLELLCSHQAALSLKPDSELDNMDADHHPMDSHLVRKIEWLRKTISFVAAQNMHLNNVVVAFVVKHLTVPDSVGATLNRRLNRKSAREHDALFTTTQPEHEEGDRAPKRIAVEAPLESGHLKVATPHFCESAQFSLLNLILTSLKSDKEPAEKFAVITEQFLLRVLPPVPAPNNEQYGEILPRKPIFDRDVAIEHQMAKCPAIMSILEIISLAPIELIRCNEFVRPCLAIVIGRWNLLASSQAQPTTSQLSSLASPPLVALTQQLWRILSAGQWLPPLLANCEDIFSACTPQDSVQILMAVWNFIKENPPVPGLYYRVDSGEETQLGRYERRFKADVNIRTAPYVNILMLILRKNVHRLPGLLLSKLLEMQRQPAANVL